MCLIYGAAVLSLSLPLRLSIPLSPSLSISFCLQSFSSFGLSNTSLSRCLWLISDSRFLFSRPSPCRLSTAVCPLSIPLFFHLFLHSSLIHVMRRGRAHWVIHFNHNKQAQISALSRNDLHRRGRRRGEARRGHNCQKATFFSVSSEPVLIFRLTLSLMRGKFQTFDFYRAMKNMLIQNRKVTLHLTHSASFKL